MDTRLIDVHDDDVCARVYAVITASNAHQRPWNEPPSLAETLVEWRHVDEAERMEMWGAWDGDELVGVGTIWLPMTDNTSMVWHDVQVDPPHRTRGAGSMLVDRIVARAHEESRATLVTDLMVPPESDGHPYRRFAEKHGYHLSNTEIMRHLALPVDDDLLTRHAERARPRWAGAYRLETYVGGVPEPLQQSLCAVMNQLAVDAPTGDIEFEEESLTPARYREHLEVFEKQGRVRLTTVAVEERSGDVVAYTDLVLPSGAPSVAWQWGTLVHKGTSRAAARHGGQGREPAAPAGRPPRAQARHHRQRRHELVDGLHQRGPRLPRRRALSRVPAQALTAPPRAPRAPP